MTQPNPLLQRFRERFCFLLNGDLRFLNETDWVEKSYAPEVEEFIESEFSARDARVVETVAKVKKSGLRKKEWDSETSREDVYARALNDLLTALKDI